jgi:hypothetical protein
MDAFEDATMASEGEMTDTVTFCTPAGNVTSVSPENDTPFRANRPAINTLASRLTRNVPLSIASPGS